MSSNGRAKTEKGPRVNHQIKISPVLVIDENGSQVGVMEVREAREKASEAGLDLVEVQPDVRPPVTKIIDYGKYKYDLKKKQQKTKKSQAKTELKEIRVRPKTEEHDLNVKIKSVKKFIEQGNKCQITVKFRGRENTHPQKGRDVIDRFTGDLSDVAKIEKPAKHEGRQITAIIGPK